ncbi:MAG: LEA type 2 family protein [Pseudomonadota bacterium]
MRKLKTALLFISVTCISACAILDPTLEAYVVNVTPLSSSLLEQRARLTMRLQNLSDTPVSANGIDVRLIVNERQLARGVANKEIVVAGLSETTTSVDLSSRSIDAIRQVIGIQQRDTYSYRLKGRLHTAGRDHRFDHGGEISRQELLGLLQAAP